jgi:pentatricopeptide repeat protein
LELIHCLDRELHARHWFRLNLPLMESAFPRDLLVDTTLVSVYWKAGTLPDAHSVFDKMPEQISSKGGQWWEIWG